MDVGEFVIGRYQIDFPHWGQTHYLIPFGDIHRSSPLCHEEKWKEFLAWAKKKPRCHFVGMGDYDDMLSGSERQVIRRDAIHESTEDTLDAVFKAETDRLIKELSFMRGRIVGLLEGNHFVRFRDGTTSTQRMCQALECRYLGSSAFIRITFENHGVCLTCDVWAHHGLGAARLIGGSLNRVQQLGEIGEADVFLMGHDHRKAVAPSTRLRLMNDSKALEGIRLSHRKQVFCRTGSFLRGYVPGARSYVAHRQLNPTDLGVVKIELTPKCTHHDREQIRFLDIHASV